MNRFFIPCIFVLYLVFISGCVNRKAKTGAQTADDSYSGSVSCVECHEKFYSLWRTSYHAQAMMPVDTAFIRKHRLPDSQPVAVEGHFYQVEFRDSTMMMFERNGNQLVAEYRILWAMGGRNVYCFLTPFEKGKLQTIPLAYDVNRKSWFNYPESSVRHFGDESPVDEALPWKNAMYTFNTGCHSCHVSQLRTNFDLATETYHTTWHEPGINCETCHGPAAEHIRIFRNLKEGEKPEKLGLISTSGFTPEQHTASCSPCHARMNPITPGYMPGDRYFDNYNLATLEDRDFYPDGRDLGENYTLTGWMMNPCVQKSDLHCVTCHTSSGRDRNKDNPNNSCIKCHDEKGESFESHSGHKITDGLTCLSCHMPKREFVGHFLRSDHSFRPPMPQATQEFGSPNACNQCHQDKSPAWANSIVKKRTNGNYQEETLRWARLIKEARSGNWKNSGKMYGFIQDENTNEIIATSLIRLLAECRHDTKWPVLLDALQSRSELVRSAAALGLSGYNAEEAKNALLKACGDSIRLVRINAAVALLNLPPDRFTSGEKAILDKAEQEYVTSLTSRPDDWSSHYNLGNHYQNKGNAERALQSYENALKIFPDAVMPLVNSSMLYALSGNTGQAEAKLNKAMEVDPQNVAVNLNYGLLMAEQQQFDKAETAFRNVLQSEKNNATALYNLSIIVSSRDLNEACKLSRKAMEAVPQDPKYAYTHAYFLNGNQQKKEALILLEKTVRKFPDHLSSVFLLGNIYLESGNKGKTLELYYNTLNLLKESPQAQAQLNSEIARIRSI